MRIYPVLIFVLYGLLELDASISDLKVFFRNNLDPYGYVYGTANVNCNVTTNTLTVKLPDFQTMFTLKTNFQLLVGQGTSYETCDDLPNGECSFDLSTITSLHDTNITLEGNPEHSRGNILFIVELKDRKFEYDKCVQTNDVLLAQCVCPLDKEPGDICNGAKPTPCYKVEIDSEFNHEELWLYSVPTIKIMLETSFIATAEPKTVYIRDDSINSGFMLIYRKPSVEKAKPINDTVFALDIIMSGTWGDSAVDVDHTNYVIFNFKPEYIILFNNAFCSIDGSYITCLCCEKSERNSMCKSKPKNQEIDVYSTAFIPNYGHIDLRAKTWINENKRFMIDLRDSVEKYFPEDSKYFIESINSTSVVEIRQCVPPNIENPCTLNITKDIVNVNFKACPTNQCTILTSILIDNQQINVKGYTNGCNITQDNNNYCNCLHGVNAESIDDCIIKPTTCNSTSNDAFTIDLEPNYEIIFPLMIDRLITAFDSKSNKDYVFKLSTILPFSSSHPKTDDYWIMKVWISSTETVKSIPENKKNTVDFSFVPENKTFMYFSQAFCHYNYSLKRMHCVCCDDSDDTTSSQCQTSKEYGFHFSKKTTSFGSVFGSGRVWTSNNRLYAIVTDVDPALSYDNYFSLKIEGQEPPDCPINDICWVDVEGDNDSVALFYKIKNFETEVIFEEVVVKFELSGGEIQHNDSGKCESQGDKACICPSGIQPADSTCPLDKPIQCTQLIINGGSTSDVPSISFKYYGTFSEPGINNGEFIKYLKADHKYFKLYYKSVNSLELIHPFRADNAAFMLNLSIVKIDTTDQNTCPSNLNFDPGTDLYIFENAFCKINRITRGEMDIECTCCDGYTGDTAQICMQPKINSEINIEFSVTIPDIGYIFMKGKLFLDARELFTFKGSELYKAFNNRVQLNFVLGRGTDAERLRCNEWMDCRFKFYNRLKANDVLKMSFMLLDANWNELNLTEKDVDNFLIGSGSTIQYKSTSCVNGVSDSTTKYCVCPKDSKFTKTCKIVEPSICQNITTIYNNVKVNGYPRKNAAFLITLSDIVVENQHVYVKSTIDGYYYTFSYENCPGKECKSKIGPTNSKQTAVSSGTIQMNFDASSNMVIFEKVQCNVTKTTWACECCLLDECNKVTTSSPSTTAISKFRSSIKPTTNNPNPVTQPTNSTSKKEHSNTVVIVCLSILIPIILLFMGISAYFYWRYRKRIEEEKQLMPGHINNRVISDIRATKVSDDPWEMFRDEVIVRYDKKLGCGAFSDVYLGKILGDAAIKRVYSDVLRLSTFHDCDIAVKVLPTSANAKAKEDFYTEIEFMKSLKYHAHLVCLMGYVQDEIRPLLLIEFCKNGDLLHFIRTRKIQISLGKEEDMKTRDLLSFCWQISSGLEYIASLDLVHRDIAARNVLLDKDNVCKISDFGLCRLADNSLYTDRGGKLPARWLSIESFKTSQYSMKTDVWSYGVLLFELFSMGDIPYAELENSDILKFLEEGNRLSQPSYATDEAYEIMMNCWEVEPEDRRSFTEICHQLSTIMENSNELYNYIDANKQAEALELDNISYSEI